MFGVFAVFLALIGYCVYGKKLLDSSNEELSSWPWVIFFLLGFNDFANFLTADDSNYFEIFAGLLVFLGPLVISLLIIQRVRKNKQRKPVHESILGIEIFMLALVSVAIVSITVVEILTRERIVDWGSKIFVEYGFMCFAIVLDLIALKGLFVDIKKFPDEFEYLSWICFLFAGIFASIFDITIGAQIGSVGLILIFENVLVSCLVIIGIAYYRKV